MVQQEDVDDLHSQIQKDIDLIEEYRDTYFDSFPGNKEEARQQSVREKVQESLEKLAVTAESSLSHTLLAARLWNVCINYEEECETLLSRYIKLNPDDLDSWAEMGCCLLKKPDVDAAVDCLEYALTIGKTAPLLSQLATALRFQMGTVKDVERVRKMRLQSILYSEEAVKIDPDYGPAWFSLGNARFAYFFATEQQHAKYITGSIEAYRRALQFRGTLCNPDLHLNLAAALRYEESFGESLHHSRLALKYDGDSEETVNRLNSMEKYLIDVNEAVEKKGCLRGKRLTDLVSSLSPSDISAFPSASLSLSLLSNLSSGVNPGKAVLVRVAAIIITDQQVPCTFVVCDSSETCFALTVYNFSSEFSLLIGDSLAISEPFVTRVTDITIRKKDKDVHINFNSLRVSLPTQILRNGKALKTSQVALTKVDFSAVAQ